MYGRFILNDTILSGIFTSDYMLSYLIIVLFSYHICLNCLTSKSFYPSIFCIWWCRSISFHLLWRISYSILPFSILSYLCHVRWSLHLIVPHRIFSYLVISSDISSYSLCLAYHIFYLTISFNILKCFFPCFVMLSSNISSYLSVSYWSLTIFWNQTLVLCLSQYLAQ